MSEMKPEARIADPKQLPIEAVGVQRFDEEHMHLMELLLRTTDAIRERDNAVYLREAVSDVFSYAITHFSEEENFMAEISYPGLEEHRREHARMMEHLQRNLHQYEHDPWRVAMEIVQLLEDWMIRHIEEFDVPYGNYLRQH